MRSKGISKKSLVARLLVTLLIAVGFQFATLTPPAQAAVSGSLYLNNTSLSHVFNANLDVGTGQFTIEMWIKPVGQKAQPLWGSNVSGARSFGADSGLSSSCYASDRLAVFTQGVNCGYSTSAGTFVQQTAGNETWMHVVWQRGASNMESIYVNGVRLLNQSNSGNLGLNSGPLKIGSSERGAFTGYITNVRLVKGVGIYSGTTFSPPTEALSASVASGITSLLLSTTTAATALSDSSVNSLNMSTAGSNNIGSTVATTPLGGFTWSSETPFAPPVIVSYNYNGANGLNSVTSDTYRDTDLTLPAPTKTNFTFDGWYESDSFTGTQYRTSYSSAVSRTLNAKWSKTQYSVTFDAQRGTPVSNGSFTYTDAVQRPSDPTRNGYRFKGWSAASTGPLETFPYLPSVLENKMLYAQWEQKSLVGINTAQLVNPTVITPNGTDQTLISTRAASGNVARTRTIINYYDGALPSSYDVSVYTLPDNTFATEQLGSDQSYIISQVIAWKDRVNGDVTDTALRKEIEMTIESTEIKSGAKVYSILDGVSTLLATATTDGSVTVKFATDPVIVVAAAPPAPPSPPSSDGAGGSIPLPSPSPTSLPVSNFAKTFNILGFNPGSWQLTKSIKKSIDAFFKSISKPNKISCVGYTTGPTVLSGDAKLAVRRGQEVCRYISVKNPTIAHVITKGTTTKVSGDFYRRTKVTVSN